MKILLISLFFSLFASAQKVDVYNKDGILLTPIPIDKKEVPDSLKEQPDGEYLLRQIQPLKDEEGNFLFVKCWYKKETKINRHV